MTEQNKQSSPVDTGYGVRDAGSEVRGVRVDNSPPESRTPNPKKRSPVAVFLGYLTGIGRAMFTLVKGIKVPLYYLFSPKEIVTEEYPENRETLKMHPVYRGRVMMPHDEEGEHRCTGCSLCERACPNGSISVLNTKNLAGQKVLGQYVYRYSQCTLCALCVESCPYDAIRMSPEYEVATTDRDSLDLVLNLKEGRA